MEKHSNTLPIAAAAFATMASGLTLIGWQFQVPLLTNPLRANFMAPNTALCFIAASLALLFQCPPLSRAKLLWSKAFAAFVALGGILVVLEDVLHWDFSIDQVFMAKAIHQWSSAEITPGRFAPNTAAGFIFLGIALFASSGMVGKFRLAELIVLPSLLISFLTLIGYAYGAENLSGLPRYSKMAPQTAICFATLAFGVLWVRRDRGLMATILSPSVSGIAARRLLLSTLITLPVLGLLRIQSNMPGALELRSGTAVLVISSVVVFCFMILHTTFILADLDEKRRSAEETVLRSRDDLQSLVEKRTEALRELSSRLMHSKDDSQRKIAQDLHEGFGQNLVGLNLKLAQAAEKPHNPQLLRDAITLLDQTLDQIKLTSYSLHPPLLEEVGFVSAASWYVGDFASRNALAVKLHLPPSLPKFSAATELGLYRVLQESLSNVKQHSGSSRAEVRIEKTAAKVIIEVQDFGRGIDPAILKDWETFGVAGVGLTGMRQRLSELRGQLEVHSSQQGTTIRATLPLSARLIS